MGRPPFGKTAMTGAERTRQYRERLKAQPPKPNKGEIDTGLQRENARLKAESSSVELQREVERLKAQNAILRTQAADGVRWQQSENELRQAKAEIERLKANVRYERAKRDEARMRARKLDAKLKVKEELPKDVATLQQQLTAAKTRNLNLRIEVKAAWQARDEARKANPVTITKAEHRKLNKVFHPDTGAHATEKQLTEAAQIFTALKFKFLD